jgi:hypothetical protein
LSESGFSGLVNYQDFSGLNSLVNPKNYLSEAIVWLAKFWKSFNPVNTDSDRQKS